MSRIPFLKLAEKATIPFTVQGPDGDLYACRTETVPDVMEPAYLQAALTNKTTVKATMVNPDGTPRKVGKVGMGGKGTFAGNPIAPCIAATERGKLPQIAEYDALTESKAKGKGKSKAEERAESTVPAPSSNGAATV